MLLAMECGTKLEILRKEKIDNKKAAFYINPIYILLHCLTLSCKRGILMIVLIFTLKGVLRDNDLLKYLTLGPAKGAVSRPYSENFVLVVDI